MYHDQNDIEAPLYLVARVWRTPDICSYIPDPLKVSVMYPTDNKDDAEEYYLDALKTYATEIAQGQFRIEIYHL